jgi:hypothetical protein
MTSPFDFRDVPLRRGRRRSSELAAQMIELQIHRTWLN